MDSNIGLLSLKWNNHKITFFNLFQKLRQKGTCTDATISCGHKFFNVHKLILMACSDFFCELFEQISCKNPVIILKDIKSSDLEALLDYMYIGEVEVQQNNLQEIIKAAESLRIKGLAIPDDDSLTAQANKEKVKERNLKRKRLDTSNSLGNETGLNEGGVLSKKINSAPNKLHCGSSDLHQSNKYENNVDQPTLFESNEPCHQGVSIKSEENSSIPDLSLVKRENEDCLSYTNYSQNKISGFIDSCSDSVSSDIQPLDLLGSEGQLDSFDHADDPFSSVRSNESVIENPSNLSEGAPFHCPYCPRTDLYESKWKRHLRTHTGEKPFSCPHCPYRASTKHCALRHIRFKHSATSSGSAFLSPAGIPFCPHCNKIFSDRYKRDRHMMIHTGQKPYGCPVCSYRASRKDPVLRHVRLRHLQDGKNRLHLGSTPKI